MKYILGLTIAAVSAFAILKPTPSTALVINSYAEDWWRSPGEARFVDRTTIPFCYRLVVGPAGDELDDVAIRSKVMSEFHEAMQKIEAVVNVEYREVAQCEGQVLVITNDDRVANEPCATYMRKNALDTVSTCYSANPRSKITISAVDLSKWDVPVFTHELVHALGGVHENQRSDQPKDEKTRSCHRIGKAGITDAQKSLLGDAQNFYPGRYVCEPSGAKDLPCRFDPTYVQSNIILERDDTTAVGWFTTPYDRFSIMNTCNGLPSPQRPVTINGSLDELSHNDIRGLSALYGAVIGPAVLQRQEANLFMGKFEFDPRPFLDWDESGIPEPNISAFANYDRLKSDLSSSSRYRMSKAVKLPDLAYGRRYHIKARAVLHGGSGARIAPDIDIHRAEFNNGLTRIDPANPEASYKDDEGAVLPQIEFMALEPYGNLPAYQLSFVATGDEFLVVTLDDNVAVDVSISICGLEIEDCVATAWGNF